MDCLIPHGVENRNIMNKQGHARTAIEHHLRHGAIYVSRPSPVILASIVVKVRLAIKPVAYIERQQAAQEVMTAVFGRTRYSSIWLGIGQHRDPLGHVGRTLQLTRSLASHGRLKRWAKQRGWVTYVISPSL